MVVQMNEAPVAESAMEVGNILRKDMRVDVYREKMRHALNEAFVDLHHMPTAIASSEFLAGIKFLEPGQEVFFDIH